MPNRVTQQDIADELKVSRNTVSRALNDDPNIGERMRDLVYQKAAEMGYGKFKGTPNVLKQEKQSGTIALIAHANSLGNAFWYPVIIGCEQVVSKAGYRFMLSTVDESQQDNGIIPQNIQDNPPDGIIMYGDTPKDYCLRIRDLDIPIVYINIFSEYDFILPLGDIVMTTNEIGIYGITKHLLELGHQEIGFVGDIGSSKSFLERWMGYHRAMMEAGLSIDKRICVLNTKPRHYFNYKEIQDALGEIKQKPTAFVCANDTNAIDVIQALKESGLRVPQDVSVTGFDDIREAMIVSPKLTTVYFSKEDMGRRAADQILWRIKNPERSNEVVRIMTQIVHRESVKEI